MAAAMPRGAHCNHCGADDAVVPVSDCENDQIIYVCDACGWWGFDPLRVDFRPNDEITTTLSREQARVLQFRRGGGSRDR
jgi:hypothetical protein